MSDTKVTELSEKQITRPMTAIDALSKMETMFPDAYVSVNVEVTSHQPSQTKTRRRQQECDIYHSIHGHFKATTWELAFSALEQCLANKGQPQITF